ncbi:MAG: GNAT family N-acetyltransferase [Bacteriovoracaceae bacterium]|nr:GNAT family N-acetyltransferase [Bacteriovoracaceae bacterium]
MEFTFNKIDKVAFIRIWNSDFQDGFPDSHKNPFEKSSENEWQPLLEKHLKVMREVELNGQLIGYIFLSPKADGSAHLGYGLYKGNRGKGFSIKMCKQFLKDEIPSLSKDIKKIFGTTLKENIISQIVLEKLGFVFLEELDDPEFEYVRFERDLTIP